MPDDIYSTPELAFLRKQGLIGDSTAGDHDAAYVVVFLRRQTSGATYTKRMAHVYLEKDLAFEKTEKLKNSRTNWVGTWWRSSGRGKPLIWHSARTLWRAGSCL